MFGTIISLSNPTFSRDDKSSVPDTFSPPILLSNHRLERWSYSFGSYAEPTLFIYGEQSYTAEIYRRPGNVKDKLPGGFSLKRGRIDSRLAC